MGICQLSTSHLSAVVSCLTVEMKRVEALVSLNTAVNFIILITFFLEVCRLSPPTMTSSLVVKNGMEVKRKSDLSKKEEKNPIYVY